MSPAIHLVPREPDADVIETLRRALVSAETGEITSLAIAAWGPDNLPIWFISDGCAHAVLAPLAIVTADITSNALEAREDD